MAQSVATQTVAEARGIVRDFVGGDGGAVHALRGLDLTVRAGELIALQGRSGSGKTTLLNILAGLDDPTRGTVAVIGHELRPLSETQRALLRREAVGMMFQNAHLVPVLTAQENVELPLRLAQVKNPARAERARRVLELVGLGPRAHHRGLELSGGEQQRVALARALVHAPRFVLADEPTGNLDSMTAVRIAELLRDIAHNGYGDGAAGPGLLIATHDATVANVADRILRIQDGQLAEG